MIKQKDIPIASLTSFKNAGTVPQVIICETIEDLKSTLKTHDSYYILGKGSNTIINPDTTIKTFIKLAPNITETQVSGTQLQTSGGTSVNRLLTLSQEHNLSGIEFIAGVPASLGGMIAMNFGCWEKELATVIQKVRILTQDGDDRWITKEDCGFGYRKSTITENNWIIIEAILDLTKSNAQDIKKTIQKNIETRLAHQPLRAHTCGCVFKNPKDHIAGKIIDELGYKGRTLTPSLALSKKHANFIVNTGGATYKDTLNTIQEIQTLVKQKRNIDLELEVKVVQ